MKRRNMPQTFTDARFPGVIGTFMGRDALSLALSWIPRVRDAAVLLPIYTCQDVVRKFARCGTVVYYDLRPDLTIDPSEIRAKLRSNRIGLTIITNYFGFLQPHRLEIKALCEASGSYLLEDCAHSLLTEGSGETGDIAIYSFRKILPIPDGGGLKLNMKMTPPAVRYHPTAYSNALSMLITAKSMLAIHSNKFNRAAVENRAKAGVPDSESPETMQRILPLSPLTRRRMGRLSFAEVIENRRRDFRFWLDVCKSSDSVAPVFEDLPGEVCPHGFPVKMEDRDSFEAMARQKGAGLSVHWRLDPAIGSDCTTSHRLTRELITLPIYPELTPRRREAITRLLHQRGPKAAKTFATSH